MKRYHIINVLVALVWFVNGLICKILSFEPRHEAIVARILGGDYSRELTVLIGIAELIMALWIVSSFGRKLCVIVQVIVIATMNIIEFILAPDLLLWGRFNLVFALLLIAVIIVNELHLRYRPALKA